MNTHKNNQEPIETFSIRDYMWHIFEIKDKQQQINVRVAYDMFIINLELKSERYKGAKGLKYRHARKLWNELNDRAKKSQYRIFNSVLNRHFSGLYRAFGDGDKELFMMLCKK